MTSTLLRHLTSVIGLALFVASAAATQKSDRTPRPAAEASHTLPIRASGTGARVAAAKLFTTDYAASRFGSWNIHASAAGPQCSVLLVDTDVVMEDSMVEAMHYGAGAYAVYDGGVQHFYLEHKFRGVAYRDGSGRVWPYGSVIGDAEALHPCE